MNSNTGNTDSGASRSPSPSPSPPPQVYPVKKKKPVKKKQTLTISASAVVAKEDVADAVAMETVPVATEELTGTEAGGETTRKKYLGVAKWQMRGYDSKEEAEALGFYKKGDVCEHCGKVFQRLYPKFLHYDQKGDTRCSGKLKRPARQQGKTSVLATDNWVKKVSSAMVLLDEIAQPYDFTAKDFMSWLTTDKNHSGKGLDIIVALNNKMFLKTALKKGVEEAPDVKLMGYALLPDGTKTEEYETAESVSFARFLDDRSAGYGADDSSWALLKQKAREFDIDINID